MIYVVTGAVALVFFLLGVKVGERFGVEREDRWQAMAQRVMKDAEKTLGKERVAEIFRKVNAEESNQ